MLFWNNRFLPLLHNLLILVVSYLVCRIWFVVMNFSEFDINNYVTTTHIFISGIRYDISAILLTNVLFILAYLLPFTFTFQDWYGKILKWLFVIVNSIFILFNLIDVVYFPFVQKRMQSDTLLFLTGEKGNEAFGMITVFIIQYWYLWLFYFGMIYFLFKSYIRKSTKTEDSNHSLMWYLKSGSLGIFILALIIIGIRGGLQLRPINLINATESNSTRNVPAVINSTFSLLRTWNKNGLESIHYVNENTLNSCDLSVHSNRQIGKNIYPKTNVVIIMVESLSKEYVGFFGGTCKTPFLDSLMKESLVFSNGFANARESIQGIPAVLASIPSLQDEPFIFSKYATNNINSLASILKKDGYLSAFFHGATTGTMGFYSFSKTAGFDDYFGMEDYGNQADFDGSWGIWDQPFMQFMAKKLTEYNGPFVASILTLNSHHPFELPIQYASKFRESGHPIKSSMRYVDLALQEFFDTAKKQPWFSNTIFVVTADHTGPKTTTSSNSLDDYRIPIIFYKADGSLKGLDETIANQIDILPSVLHLTGTDALYFSIGRDLFDDKCSHHAINYKMGLYQYVDNRYLYQFNGQKGLSLFDWKNDKKLKTNLISDSNYQNSMDSCDVNIKKIIQVFNNAMIDNQMSVTKK